MVGRVAQLASTTFVVNGGERVAFGPRPGGGVTPSDSGLRKVRQRAEFRVFCSAPGGSAMAYARVVLIWSVLLCVVSARPAAAQERVTLPNEPSCGGCRIELQRLTTVGDSAGPGMLAQQGTVVVDSRGRVFAFTNYDPSRIQVFDRSGRHLITLGRPGSGPGEFRGVVTAAIASGDTLIALDYEGARLAVIDPELRFQRHVLIPGMSFQFVPVSGGRYVFASELRTRDPAANPLQLADSTGRVVRRFGGGAGTVNAGFYNAWRQIGSGADGTVWSARVNEYRLEQYDATGTARLTLVRRPPWFEPWTEPTKPNEKQPMPQIRGARQVGERLWVLIHVADAQWEPRPPVQCGGPGMLCVADSDWEHIYDTVIEVIDLPRRRLVASTRVSQRLLGFAGEGIAASYEEDAGGNPRYAVWRLVLREP